MPPPIRWCAPRALAALLVCGLPGLAAAQKQADPGESDASLDEQVRKLANESPPDFDASSIKPWATQNLRLNGGIGYVSVANSGAEQVGVDAFGLQLHGHAGDTFVGFFSYYVPLRLTLLSFNAVRANGATVTNFNKKQGYFVESGLGVEIWPWPEVIALSVEGVGNFMTLLAAPVQRADYNLASEALGAAGRARLTLQVSGMGVFAEYQQQLLMQDLANGSGWRGFQAFVGLTYHLGGKFDSKGR